MKATLEFSLPEQEREYLQSVYGPKMALALWKFQAFLDKTEEKEELLSAREIHMEITGIVDELDIPWRLVFNGEV